MKIFTGIRTENGCQVLANGKPLNPRFDLWRHSPTGYEWGYGGSGPAQLALALVSNVLGKSKDKDELAVRVHQTVKQTVVATLPHDRWVLTEDEIKVAIAEALKEKELRESKK